jgi:hypothetical protein
MDAALKEMFTLGQIRDLGLAGLKDSSFGDRDVLKAAGTFGNRVLSVIEPRYEAATELRHLGEGVGLAALVDYGKNSSFFDLDRVRFEVPSRIRSSIGCFCK